jgi:hypothetical protein
MSDHPKPLSVFAAYAAAFEETYVDDDWKRLEPFFDEAATYSVVNLGPVTCCLRGRDELLSGIRKSVNGFDRRFAVRKPEILGTPREDGTNVRVEWRVTYSSPNVPDLPISAFSLARIVDGRIAELADVYDAGVVEAYASWQDRAGMAVDASYV